jgi:hypothetical protein
MEHGRRSNAAEAFLGVIISSSATKAPTARLFHSNDLFDRFIRFEYQFAALGPRDGGIHRAQ